MLRTHCTNARSERQPIATRPVSLWGAASFPIRHHHGEKQMSYTDKRQGWMSADAAPTQDTVRKAGVCILGVALLACSTMHETHARTVVEDDLERRTPDIHWPTGFTPDKADLFAHNEIQINASCKKVFNTIAHAEKWPSWYPNSKDVKVRGARDGTLKRGSRFDWNTFGLAVHSRVHEFVPGRRIGWFGDADNLKAYHTWLLTPKSGGCFVQTEEVVKGQGAIDLRKSDPAAMHKGHDVWNETLKAAAEAD